MPERSSAFLRPSNVANVAYENPLGLPSNLSSGIRTSVTEQSARKSLISPSVVRKFIFAICTVYGGFVGSGNGSRTE